MNELEENNAKRVKVEPETIQNEQIMEVEGQAQAEPMEQVGEDQPKADAPMVDEQWLAGNLPPSADLSLIQSIMNMGVNSEIATQVILGVEKSGTMINKLLLSKDVGGGGFFDFFVFLFADRQPANHCIQGRTNGTG